MKKALFFSMCLGIFSSQSHAMSSKEICDIRADLMYAMTVERDAGKTKKQVKSVMKNKFGSNLPNSFDLYLDAVYEGRKYSPDDMKVISLYSCYKEFGLIK